MSSLGDLMVSRGGSVNPGAFRNEEFELYSIPAHDRGGPEIALGSNIGSSKQIVRPGDVMISKIIPHIRRARVVSRLSGRRQIASGEWIVFRGDDFDPNYLRHFLISDVFHGQFMNTVAGVGGSLVRARPEQVKAIPVPLPPLDEQRRIAAILDHADALRAKRRQVLAHLDLFAHSIFHEMFGAPDSWPDRWPMGTIGDMSESVQYGSSAKAGSKGKWPMLRMGNVTDDGRLELNSLKYVDLEDRDIAKYTVRRGDLLFNRTNSKEKVGKSCVVDTDLPLAFAGYLVRVRFKQEHCSEFVCTYLTSTHGLAVRRRMAKAAVNQANINATEMRGISIAHPPTELQNLFAARLQKVQVLRQAVLVAKAADDELFFSLQSRAFRGEL